MRQWSDIVTCSNFPSTNQRLAPVNSNKKNRRWRAKKPNKIYQTQRVYIVENLYIHTSLFLHILLGDVWNVPSNRRHVHIYSPLLSESFLKFQSRWRQVVSLAATRIERVYSVILVFAHNKIRTLAAPSSLRGRERGLKEKAKSGGGLEWALFDRRIM